MSTPWKGQSLDVVTLLALGRVLKSDALTSKSCPTEISCSCCVVALIESESLIPFACIEEVCDDDDCDTAMELDDVDEEISNEEVMLVDVREEGIGEIARIATIATSPTATIVNPSP